MAECQRPPPHLGISQLRAGAGRVWPLLALCSLFLLTSCDETIPPKIPGQERSDYIEEAIWLFVYAYGLFAASILWALTCTRRRLCAIGTVVFSVLDSIPGIGPKRKRALLRKFGSVKGVREATLDDIAATVGFTRGLAETVKRSL